MNNEKSIKVLNTLLEINNDRIAGYETASKDTNESDLKSLFADLKQTSLKCKAELISEIQKLGGTPEEGTKETGKLYRVWMDIKAALTGKDRKAILSSCEYGEDVALKTYRDELKDSVEYLTPEQQTLLNTQLGLILADHNKVKTLRDAVKSEAR
jgi:uncharacterized protein (TIGR02284 family)